MERIDLKRGKGQRRSKVYVNSSPWPLAVGISHYSKNIYDIDDATKCYTTLHYAIKNCANINTQYSTFTHDLMLPVFVFGVCAMCVVFDAV
jgi:hypothetical protein